MTDNFKHRADSALSSLHVNAHRQQQLLEYAMEEQNMKKKTSATLIIMLALMIALCSIGIADVLNLFTHFTQYDQRLESLAPTSLLESPVSVTVESPLLGKTTLTFTNACFDEEYILLAYTAENELFAQQFTPTEEQLSQLIKFEESFKFGIAHTTTAQAELEDAFITAQNNGTPFGVHTLSIYAETICVNDELLIRSERMRRSLEGDGLIYHLNYFEMPQGAVTENQNKLTVDVNILLQENLLWFDGNTHYLYPSPNETVATVSLQLNRSAEPVPTPVS